MPNFALTFKDHKGDTYLMMCRSKRVILMYGSLNRIRDSFKNTFGAWSEERSPGGTEEARNLKVCAVRLPEHKMDLMSAISPKDEIIVHGTRNAPVAGVLVRSERLQALFQVVGTEELISS